jgi:hypothetical protein
MAVRTCSSMPATEEETLRQRREQALDTALELTFPASDPIAVSAPTPEPRALDSGEVIRLRRHRWSTRRETSQRTSGSPQRF